MNDTPVGTILPYAGPVNSQAGTPQQTYPPSGSRAYDLRLERLGWLVCDGRAVAVARYPLLFQVIGYIYGRDGAGFFRLPDYRGRTLRGVNDAATGPDNLLRDPDAAGRLPSADGGWHGNQVGTVQDDALQAHAHDYLQAVPAGAAAEGSAVFGTTRQTATTGLIAQPGFTPPVTPRQAAETRGKNVSVNFIIRHAGSCRTADFPIHRLHIG